MGRDSKVGTTCGIGFALVALALCPIAANSSDLTRGFTLPSELAGFQRGTIIDNEPRSKGLGISVPYTAPGVQATVYIYDRGIQSLPDGFEAPAVQEQAQQAVRDIFITYTEVHELKKLAPGVGSCSKFLRAEFSYINPRSNPAELLHSYLYVGGRKGNFVKIRITHPAKFASAIGEVAELRFAQELCKSTYL